MAGINSAIRKCFLTCSSLRYKGLSLFIGSPYWWFKLEIRSPNCETNQNEERPKSKTVDLEERTFAFAKRVREFVKRLSKTIGNVEDSRQLIRSSGSVGANYIEANESFSKKDFVLRIKICRKEAKESRYWLRLIEAMEESLASERELLAQELMNIFGAIVRQSE